MKKAWVLTYPLSTQWRFRSDWADAQADLSLRWAHTHCVGFVISWLILCLMPLFSEDATNVKAVIVFSFCNIAWGQIVRKKIADIFWPKLPKTSSVETLKRTLQHTCCLSSVRKPQRNGMTRSCHRQCRERTTLPKRVLIKFAFSRVSFFCKEKMF